MLNMIKRNIVMSLNQVEFDRQYQRGLTGSCDVLKLAECVDRKPPAQRRLLGKSANPCLWLMQECTTEQAK